MIVKIVSLDAHSVPNLLVQTLIGSSNIFRAMPNYMNYY
jgi:hypothetical protein